MLVTCPSCETPYELTAEAIGATGRSVRCHRCQHRWFAAPPAAVSARQGLVLVDETAAAHDESISAFREELAGTLSAEPEGAVAATPTAELRFDEMQEMPALAGANDAPFAFAQRFDTDKLETALTPSMPVLDLAAAEAPPLVPDDLLIDAEPADAAPAPRRRRLKGRKSKSSPKRLLVPLAIGAMAVALVALFLGRHSIVDLLPQTASLYASVGAPVNVRGLEFNDVKVSNETQDGVPVLVVEGAIVNTTRAAISLPRLRFGVSNQGGHEIYAWTAQPSQPTLEPGGTQPFRSRLASPPLEARSVLVRFFTRRDAASGVL